MGWPEGLVRGMRTTHETSIRYSIAYYTPDQGDRASRVVDDANRGALVNNLDENSFEFVDPNQKENPVRVVHLLYLDQTRRCSIKVTPEEFIEGGRKPVIVRTITDEFVGE